MTGKNMRGGVCLEGMTCRNGESCVNPALQGGGLCAISPSGGRNCLQGRTLARAMAPVAPHAEVPSSRRDFHAGSPRPEGRGYRRCRHLGKLHRIFGHEAGCRGSPCQHRIPPGSPARRQLTGKIVSPVR